jgi:hypothetical protein
MTGRRPGFGPLLITVRHSPHLRFANSQHGSCHKPVRRHAHPYRSDRVVPEANQSDRPDELSYSNVYMGSQASSSKRIAELAACSGKTGFGFGSMFGQKPARKALLAAPVGLYAVHGITGATGQSRPALVR